MPEFPPITHVALTVTSLERSVPWYKDLFGSDPILDEDTGPFRASLGLPAAQSLAELSSLTRTALSRSTSGGRGSIIWLSVVPTAMS